MSEYNTLNKGLYKQWVNNTIAKIKALESKGFNIQPYLETEVSLCAKSFLGVYNYVASNSELMLLEYPKLDIGFIVVKRYLDDVYTLKKLNALNTTGAILVLAIGINCLGNKTLAVEVYKSGLLELVATLNKNQEQSNFLIGTLIDDTKPAEYELQKQSGYQDIQIDKTKLTRRCGQIKGSNIYKKLQGQFGKMRNEVFREFVVPTSNTSTNNTRSTSKQKPYRHTVYIPPCGGGISSGC